MNTPGNDDRFDDAMRRLHAQAVPQVSAGTMAELHRRCHAALAGEARPRRWFGWPVAAAFASVLAVAIVLGIGLQDASHDPATTPAIASADAASADYDEAFDALDENPDFFVWLASSDATMLAME